MAIISDIANAWTAGQKLKEWIITGGYEIRGSILGTVLACGQAQPIENWQDGLEPETYVRLTLINPF